MHLYITGTPIGNLDDMTFRAVETLKSVDAILCEDTRNTRKLTTHFNIDTPLFAYHDHNKTEIEDKLISDMKRGKTFALVSDAGMPLVSDPGYELVRRMQDEALEFCVIPGPSAYLSAVVASGIPSFQFTFFGFLPRSPKKKRETMDEIMNHQYTSVLYESPHKIKETMKLIANHDPHRETSISREITKKFEQHVRAEASELLEMLGTDIPIKGEYVIVIAPSEEEVVEAFETTPLEAVKALIEAGEKPNRAIKDVANERGLKRQDLYDAYHKEK